MMATGVTPVSRSFAELGLLTTAAPVPLAVTEADLCASDDAEVEASIAPGFLWGGAITELDAPPKAGKTTFEMRMFPDIIDGGHFLGHVCQRGPVVLILEEGKTTLRDALTRAGLHQPVDLRVIYGMAVRRLPRPAFMAEAVALAERVGTWALAVDTIAACADIPPKMENGAGEALAAMAPLREAADSGLGALMLRHDRRAGGAAGESGYRSSAISGVADTVYTLRLYPNNIPTCRRLTAVSRFDDVATEMDIDLVEDGYACLGSPAVSATVRVTKAIIALRCLDASTRREDIWPWLPCQTKIA